MLIVRESVSSDGISFVSTLVRGKIFLLLVLILYDIMYTIME